jgi:hypothetical protein
MDDAIDIGYRPPVHLGTGESIMDELLDEPPKGARLTLVPDLPAPKPNGHNRKRREAIAAQEAATLLGLEKGNLDGDEPAVRLDKLIQSIDLVERNTQLMKALRSLGKVSAANGFIETSAPDSRRRHWFEAQYDDLDHMRDMKDLQRNREMVAARKAFEKAFGKTALIRAGVTKEEAQAMTDEAYREFLQKYAGARKQKDRTSMQGKLERRTNNMRKDRIKRHTKAG